MDYLLYLDDDEYPVAAAKIGNSVAWCGEPLLPSHLEYIKNADLTCGLHCGYVSPIPHIDFDNRLNENTFRRFVSAISNDIISWDNLKEIMHNNGVTYADPEALRQRKTFEVQEIDHAKFISGSNLCINLKNPKRTFPFFNPPDARGEDTFLSTCLSDRMVLQVPVYTFHDGFGFYSHILSGALPLKFKQISANQDKAIEKRFYKACRGWIRYKPLFIFLTKPDLYKTELQQMIDDLKGSLPAICHYFNNPHYQNLIKELYRYADAAPYHAELFEKAKNAWAILMEEQIFM